MPDPLPLMLYRVAAELIGPVALRRAQARLTAGGVPPTRAGERAGRATLPRPGGPLIWLHGASLGESLSLLPVIDALRDMIPATILVTTGTASSADAMARRLPQRVLHQFAPLDMRRAVRGFLDHWRPDLGVFVESELWPQLLTAATDRGIPMALIGARLSATSRRRWAQVPATARAILGRFGRIETQDIATFEAFAALGAAPRALHFGPDLKALVLPQPVDPADLSDLTASLGPRPLWLAASTHLGEEDAVLSAHAAVRAAHPDALLILVPRHAERGAEVAALAVAHGLPVRRRSTGGPPDAAVLIGDTYGEMGLWYAAAPVTFLGGSFKDAGGHSPWEAAALGTALLTGPNVPNAARAWARLTAAGGCRTIADGAALGDAVADLLTDPAAATTLAQAARTEATASRNGEATRLARDLIALIPA